MHIFNKYHQIKINNNRTETIIRRWAPRSLLFLKDGSLVQTRLQTLLICRPFGKTYRYSAIMKWYWITNLFGND